MTDSLEEHEKDCSCCKVAQHNDLDLSGLSAEKRFDLKNKILEMIKEISGTDDLVEARAECLYSGHLFDHLANKLKLTPENQADIAFSLGRSCQLGVLFGVLWHTNNVPDDVEIKARKMFSDALKSPNPPVWRKTDDD